MSSEFAVRGKATFVFSVFSISVVFILCVVHSFRMYQDLYTIERKSVLHRRWLPQKDEKYYKLIAWCTLLSAVLYLLGRISFLLSSMSDRSSLCKLFTAVLLAGFLSGKLFMYLTFIFRLRTTFGKTSFAYNSHWLNFLALFFMLYSIVNLFLSFIAVVQKNDGCLDSVDNNTSYIVAGMILVQDGFFSLGFVLAYVVPLKRIVKRISEQKPAFFDVLDNQQRQKVFYAAVKTTTLTSITAISTLFAVVMVLVVEMDFLWLDMLFNTVCLFLMTPYYDDAIYYQNICWCCIKCCTPKNEMYKSETSNDNTKTGVAAVCIASVTLEMSADTMGQIKVCANEANIMGSPQSKNEDEQEIKDNAAPISLHAEELEKYDH